MRRLLLALSLLPALATHAAQLESSYVSSDPNSLYQPSATCVLTIDDTEEYTYSFLLDLFRRVNRDSSLTGTPWEMHFTVGVNLWEDPAAPGTNNEIGASGRLTKAQVHAIANSGIAAVALHGYSAATLDPYTSANPKLLSDFFRKSATTNFALFDSTSQQNIIAGADSLDQIIFPAKVDDYFTSGHRIWDPDRIWLAQRFRNVRVGRMHRPGKGLDLTAEWPEDSGTTDADGKDRGYTIQFNRMNLDPFAYWWAGYDEDFQTLYSPWFPINRQNVAHFPPPTGGSPDDIQGSKDYFYYLAEFGGLGVLTWHDQDNLSPGIGPDLNGTAGIEEVIRYAAQFCANGRFGREGPRMQFLTMDEAMEKATSPLDGTILANRNFKLEPSAVDADRPWGYPAGLKAVWISDGWEYITPDDADDAGDWFGFRNQTGLWGSDVGTGATWEPLILVYAVPPGSQCRFQALWSANELLETGSEHDSLSACHAMTTVDPIYFSSDWADSSGDWITAAIADIAAGTEGPFDAFGGAAPWQSKTNQGVDIGNGYTNARMGAGYAHTHDSWQYLRSLSPSTDRTNYQNHAGHDIADDIQQQWRMTHYEWTQPAGAHLARITISFEGWTNAKSDSVAVSMPAMIATGR